MCVKSPGGSLTMKAKQNAMTLFNCGCIHFCIKTAANHDKTAVDCSQTAVLLCLVTTGKLQLMGR